MRNNSVNFTDPTGHIEACEENCSEQRRLNKLYDLLGVVGYFIHEIKGQFGIQMVNGANESWTINNLMTAMHALSMINSKLSGNLKALVRGSKFILAGGGNQYYGDAATPNQVTYHVNSSSTKIALINFLHEAGHLLDNIPALNDLFSGSIGTTPNWADSTGFVDESLLSGKFNQAVQSKYILGEDGKPLQAFRPSEYWADAFANYVSGNINISETSGRAQVMYNYVQNALSPFANP